MNLTKALNVEFYTRLVAVSRYAGLFDEADHPRDDDGMFTRKGSGSSGSRSAPSGPKKPSKKPAAEQGALFQGNAQGSLFDKAPKVGSLPASHSPERDLFNQHFNASVSTTGRPTTYRWLAKKMHEIYADGAAYDAGYAKHWMEKSKKLANAKTIEDVRSAYVNYPFMLKKPMDKFEQAQHEKMLELLKGRTFQDELPWESIGRDPKPIVNQTAGRVPGTVAPVDEFIPEPVKPLAGQKSMFHLRDAILHELYRRGEISDVERYRESDPDGRWITIGGGDGGKGTHVKVKGGKIVTGPPAITGKKLDELPERGGNSDADAKEAAKPKPLPGWKEFQLKSEPAERPNPNKAKQKELGLKHGRRVGPGLEHVHDLHVDPERFQYKINVSGKKGVTGQFSDIKFNPEFAGTLHVWHDTENGKTYVVNGHHRHELAERSGYAGKLQVHYLDAANAEEARAKGALINIAGGNGTAVDAAKFMRDTGTTADELREHGVSLKGQVANDAAVLSSLSPGIFRRLALGTYRMGRALAIAQHLPEHADQDRLDHWIDRYEETKNRELSDSTVEEMAREAAQASRQQATTKGLFGEETEDRSLFVERAELKGALRRDITGRLNKFRAVATDKAASTLEGSNKINAAENKKTADRLANFLDDFDRETSFKGPVSDRLNQASQELANAPGKRKQILDRLNSDIRAILETVPEAQPDGAGSDDQGSGGPGGDGGVEDAGRQYKPAAGQKGFFARQFDREFERAVYGRARLTEAFEREFYLAGFGAAGVARYSTQWQESKHHRGQPGNAGQFGPGGGGGAKSQSSGGDKVATGGDKPAGEAAAPQTPHDAVINTPSAAYTPANPSGLDTQAKFMVGPNQYTHERTALHHAILGKMAHGVVRSAKPTVFMTGGGPASGKGTLLKAGLIAEPENAMHIDADEIKKGIPEYREMTTAKDTKAAAFAHEESADVSQMAIAHAAKNGFDAVYDSTGDSGIEKLAKKVNQMRAGGHQIVAHYVTVDTNEAIRRSNERGKKTGRFVPEEHVRGIHAGVSRVLPQAIEAGLFDEMTLWDTNEGTPRKVVSSIGKNLTVHDHGLWQQFLDKAKG